MAKKTIKVLTESNVVNNYSTAGGGGKVLDARQVNPNVSGSYAEMVYNQLQNKVEANNFLVYMGNTQYVESSIIRCVEESFQAARDYSNFSGATQNSFELGWFGFKHNENKGCFIIAISIAYGILRGYRDSTTKEWTFKIITYRGV